MDDVLTFADEHSADSSSTGLPWKILIADDDPSVHLVTKLALGDFTFEGRRLELLSAYGEDDTRRLLEQHPETALILLDVVMDTMDSGFTLVRYIRDTLKNKDVRIIMRTGQSGNAPEDRIIINYDINDFKDKTELTVAKLRTTMISSLRTYSHLKIIAEEQRKSSANRAYLHSIIDSLSSVLVTLDLGFRVLLWNQEAERWTGIEAAQAVGNDLFEVAPVFLPLKALFQDVLAAPVPGRVERSSVPLWKGNQVFAHLILQTLAGSSGTEILFRLDDRTEAKMQDEQVVRSQKVNAFSALAAGVAEELGQLLSSQTDAQLQPSQNRGLRVSGLLDRLAKFSPLVSRTRHAVDWAQVIQSRILSPKHRSKVSVVFRGPTDNSWVVAQAAALESMYDNLVENAAAAGQGTIDVSLSLVDLQESERFSHPDLTQGKFWCLAVEDHGSGMPPEVLEQAFDPYFTTKPASQGLGLGLPLVYSLADNLGGFVELSSAAGSGTKVRVLLPNATLDDSEAPAPIKSTILICDDEPLMRQVAGKILRHLGYEVVETQDGTSALEAFRSHKPRVALAILDMILPGIPGLEIFQEMQKIDPSVPVLLSSGFGRGESVEAALSGGLAGFLQKPYRAEDLARAVKLAIAIRKP